MDKMFFCFTVDDVAFDGYSTESHFENLLSFCADEQIKATFFIVPRCRGKELGDRPGYVRLLQRAASQGHEAAQHGLDHDRFECGIPPQMILNLPHEGPAREHLAKHRKKIEESLAVENLRSMLRHGRELLEQVLRQPVVGFRAPCLSKCDNLYRALGMEGYRYDSSKVLQPAAWDIWNGKKEISPRPITREVFDARQADGHLRVLPLTAEYAWYLKQDSYRAILGLAKHDFDACQEAGIPFVSLCHVSPVQEGAGNCGLNLFRELLTYARRLARARGVHLMNVTLSEACARFVWANSV